MNNTKHELTNRMFKHNDYRRIMHVRALGDEQTDNEKMIIEGKAITFDEPAVLFTHEGLDYKEVILRDALTDTDISKTFLKYNHSDAVMAMARTKNGTLHIENRDDGVYIRAELANTTAGKDLYELIKRGDIDSMSFAFTIKDETYDKQTRTWSIKKIDTLYDISAVTLPAYEKTELYARRYVDAEAQRRQEVEALALERRRLIMKVRIEIHQTGGKHEEKRTHIGN